MEIAVTVFVTAFLTDLIGYLIHRLTHFEFMGFIYEAHMNHHLKQYPPNDFTSERYKSAGFDSFTLYFIPPTLSIIAILYWILDSELAFYSITTLVIVAVLNDVLHTKFHIASTFLRRFRYFKYLQDLHYVHHVDMEKNYGILSPFFDWLFGNYKYK